MQKKSFHKGERLKSRKSIEKLFREGAVHKCFPFVLLYREAENQAYPALMTVAVPKKLIRKAADRNLLKRRTREAYRLMKQELYNSLGSQGKQVELLFLYKSEKPESHNNIAAAVKTLLGKLTTA